MQPEHCFWNGVSTDFYGYAPCDAVAASWVGRVVVFEVQLEPCFPGQPKLIAPTDLYPTGRWAAISPDSRMLDHVPDKQAVLQEMRMSVDNELFELIIGASDDSESGS